MLTPQQIHQFHEDGFLNYGPILTPDETARLREALARVERGEGAAHPDAMRNMGDDQNVVIQIVNIWEAEPDFAAHLYHDRIVPMVAQLIGTDTLRVWHDQVQIKPPFVGGPTTWHQDHPYWPVIQPADLVSAWVALEDADRENGCMSMVRGSHKWGAYKSGTIGTDMTTYDPAPDDLSLLPPDATIEVVSVPVVAGGVVFHHCLTWHGAPINRTPRPRPAIAVHYMPAWTRYEPQGRTHLVEEHITVAPGEMLKGDHFPTVFDKGQVLTAPQA